LRSTSRLWTNNWLPSKKFVLVLFLFCFCEQLKGKKKKNRRRSRRRKRPLLKEDNLTTWMM
jgi:hypothetical protein